ncbi:MAG: hypothetical protein WC464_06000 [Bdellovibrionales bacterium]
MKYETLRLIRNLLLRCFVIGFLFAVFLCLVTYFCWTPCVGLIGGIFHINEAALSPLVIKFFLNIRFFLIFLVLVPALAIHWTLKREKLSR